ncbi:unnamed protein product [Scytosiphon promiscuus]
MAAVPPLPPRPHTGRCDCDRNDPVTTPSAWEQTWCSRGNSTSMGSSNGPGRINTASIQIGPTETLDLRIFCGTWNVAGRKLDSVEDMGSWLDVDKLDDEGDASDPPDLFVVGFQEVVELSAQNVVMDSFLDTQSRTNSLQWFTQVYAFLAQYGERHGVRYAMVSEKRLLGTYVLVMAEEAVCSKIGHVQTALVPTGLGGYLGNKGAVAVRMEVGGRSSLCFVCVHMAAHRENVLARNAEYKVVSSRPIFADTTGRLCIDGAQNAKGEEEDKDKESRQGIGWGSFFSGVAQGGRSGGMSPTRSSEVKKAIRAAMAFGLPKREGEGAGRLSAGGKSAGEDNGLGLEDSRSEGVSTSFGQEDEREDEFPWIPNDEGISAGLPKTKTVLQADIVFWFGDLNYRITEEISDQEVFEMLGRDDLETLRELDQLNIARASGTAFQEFQEGPLCFPPSYKYIPGTRDFDNRPEKKVRCPSWCDRVLYSVGLQGGDSVRRLRLDRYWSSGPLVSDHMPVSALFHTSLACTPRKHVIEPEMGVEPLSPREAATEAAFGSTPFPRIVLDPPSLSFALDRTPVSAAVEVTNTGGMEGKYHVCRESLPGWMRLDNNQKGTLRPGETAEISIFIDALAAEAAAAKELDGRPLKESACAVLRVEVDAGGLGVLLPVSCMHGAK